MYVLTIRNALQNNLIKNSLLKNGKWFIYINYWIIIVSANRHDVKLERLTHRPTVTTNWLQSFVGILVILRLPIVIIL